MATFTKYEIFSESLCNKLIDAFGPTDTYKALIHTDAPVVATDNVRADWTQIAGSNGYTTDGTSITFSSTRTGATVTATAVDTVWTAAGGNLGASTTGRYFSLQDATANLAVNSYDYGATFTVADTETMTLDFGATYFTLV